MKICVGICEFNPFHKGHEIFIEKCRSLTRADALIMIMSGNFTQRGDVAVADKFTRAKHAVTAGADAVIELPVALATAPSELFCRSGVKIADYIGDYLCFGSEYGDINLFLTAAEFFNDEPEEYKNAVGFHLKKGDSLPSARYKALFDCKREEFSPLLYSPNNLLGLEYVKAALKMHSALQLFTYKREGNYNGIDHLSEGYSSSAARNYMISEKSELLKDLLPEYISSDLPFPLPDLDELLFYSLFSKSKEMLKNLPDCTEGLENRIYDKLRSSSNYKEFLNSVKTKRYPMSRLKRIGISSLLNIDAALLKSALDIKPYIKLLAIKKGREDILGRLKNSLPVILSGEDVKTLDSIQYEIFNKDVLASQIYDFKAGKSNNPFKFIKV